MRLHTSRKTVRQHLEIYNTFTMHDNRTSLDVLLCNSVPTTCQWCNSDPVLKRHLKTRLFATWLTVIWTRDFVAQYHYNRIERLKGWKGTYHLRYEITLPLPATQYQIKLDKHSESADLRQACWFNVNENFKVIQNPGFLPDHPQNWITCSFCHSRHSLQISERSVHNFMNYLAQTDKQTLAKT